MQKPRVVHVKPPDRPVIRRCTAEFHGRAEVVVPCCAFVAGVAGDARLDGYVVAGAEVGYGTADGDDGAGAFVAEDVVVGYADGADGAGFPEVDV